MDSGDPAAGGWLQLFGVGGDGVEVRLGWVCKWEGRGVGFKLGRGEEVYELGGEQHETSLGDMRRLFSLFLYP